MPELTLAQREVLQQQIDGCKSQIALYKKSIEGKAEERSNSIEWYRDEIQKLGFSMQQYQEELDSGVVNTADDELDKLVSRLDAQDEVISALSSKVDLLEKRLHPPTP